MKKSLLVAAVLFAASMAAQAAPFITGQVYPSLDAATVSVNGANPIACVLTAATGGVQPRCDLASIVTPATYTLVMTVSKAAGCTNGTNTATCASGGTASSAPFSYVWQGGSVPVPTVQVAP